MSKAFISILGTNDYLECYHKLEDKLISNVQVKYVQEDLVKHFCKDWNSDADIRIFLTDAARKNNWFDNGHIDRATEKLIENCGLEKRLKYLELKPKINTYDIPEGNSEKELWDIFEIIYDTFKNNDEIIVDVTHSFRFLPMLLTVMLNYTRQIKNIKISGIYYAAFETLGPIPIVKQISVEERKVPIFNLTPLVKLQEWTIATFDYSTHANIKGLKKLVKDELGVITSKGNKLLDPEALLRKTIPLLEAVSNNIALCRGEDILEFKYSEIKNNLSELNKSELFIKPIKTLIDVISDKINKFQDNDINNGFVAVEWSLKHNLYQQGITILQEVLITKILMNLNLECNNLINREIVSSAIKIKSQNIPEENWLGKANENKDITKKILEFEKIDEIKKYFEKLTQIRNDVNHAGFLENRKNYQSIIDKLNNIFKNIKELI